MFVITEIEPSQWRHVEDYTLLLYFTLEFRRQFDAIVLEFCP